MYKIIKLVIHNVTVSSNVTKRTLTSLKLERILLNDNRLLLKLSSKICALKTTYLFLVPFI